MQLPEALDVALSARYASVGVRSPWSSRRGLIARMAALERTHGGKVGAARAAGVSPGAWRDWARGTHKPSPRSQRQLRSAYDQAIRLPKMLRRPPDDLAITAVVVVDPQGSRYTNRSNPYRTFRAYKVGDWRPVVEAWARHGAQEAAEAAEDAIADAYGDRFAFEGSRAVVSM